MNQINIKEKCWEENTWNKNHLKGKNNLYLISIDFQKAFDSIKRVTLIYAL